MYPWNAIIYLILVFGEFIFFLLFSIYMIFLIYSHLKGSPYVPTTNKGVDTILKAANLKRGTVFYDLGCGDGRVIIHAAKHYGVIGYGFDINPTLLLWARMRAKLTDTIRVYFVNKDINKVDLSKADVVFVFLMPEFLVKLKPKFKKELKKKTLLISHGFTIEGWDKYIVRKVVHKPFSTYFYKI